MLVVLLAYVRIGTSAAAVDPLTLPEASAGSEANEPEELLWTHERNGCSRSEEQLRSLAGRRATRSFVRVARNGRSVGIVMSMEQYAQLRGAAWDALTKTMDRLSAEASDRGLTEDKLEALLSDES